MKPVVIMMPYVQTKWEAKFELNLYACKEMLPYFFAASL